MKLRLALLAGFAATVFAGSCFAVSLSDVIQKGEAANKVMEKNQINNGYVKASKNDKGSTKCDRISAISSLHFHIITLFLRFSKYCHGGTGPAVNDDIRHLIAGSRIPIEDDQSCPIHFCNERH